MRCSSVCEMLMVLMPFLTQREKGRPCRGYIHAASVSVLYRQPVTFDFGPQLLLSPFLAALNSSILATRSLNSSYWHFSYEWRSFCSQASALPWCTAGSKGLSSWAYLALPGQVVLLLPTPVEGNQQMCAGVAVGQRQAGGAHLSARSLCLSASVTCLGGTGGARERANWAVQRGGLTLGLAAGDANGLLYLLGDGHGGAGGSIAR